MRILQSGVDVASGDDGAEITGLRERLCRLYGGEARLELSRLEADQTETVLEFPHRPVLPLPVK